MLLPATLLVVPTGGVIRNENLRRVPTDSGMMRLEAAAKFLGDCAEVLLAISGGRRDDPNDSEAMVYYRAFAERWPMLIDRVIIVDAVGKYTAADMVALAARIREWEVRHQRAIESVWFVSHTDHVVLAMISFRAGLPAGDMRPLRTLPSNEPAPYSPRI